MTKTNDQPICWTCGGTPNPDNFGGLCDPCTAARKARIVRGAQAMDRYGVHTRDADTIRLVARRHGYKG